MRNFGKNFWKLLEKESRFCSKHWLGCLILYNAFTLGDDLFDVILKKIVDKLDEW